MRSVRVFFGVVTLSLAACSGRSGTSVAPILAPTATPVPTVAPTPSPAASTAIVAFVGDASDRAVVAYTYSETGTVTPIGSSSSAPTSAKRHVATPNLLGGSCTPVSIEVSANS